MDAPGVAHRKASRTSAMGDGSTGSEREERDDAETSRKRTSPEEKDLSTGAITGGGGQHGVLVEPYRGGAEEGRFFFLLGLRVGSGTKRYDGGWTKEETDQREADDGTFRLF